MKSKKTEIKADISQEMAQIKELLKNRVYKEMKQEEIDKILTEFNEYEKQDKIKNMQILDRVYEDMLADIEEEKAKFHFKGKQKKLEIEEANIKEARENNKRKLQEML